MSREGRRSSAMSIDDQLIPMESNENPYEQLSDKRHVAAVDMRIEGYRLRYIGEFLKLKESTIREWFMTGGPCHDAYHFRRAEWLKETQELHANIRQEITSGATDAIVTLKKNARKGSTIAAKALLEMDGF